MARESIQRCLLYLQRLLSVCLHVKHSDILLTTVIKLPVSTMFHILIEYHSQYC